LKKLSCKFPLIELQRAILALFAKGSSAASAASKTNDDQKQGEIQERLDLWMASIFLDSEACGPISVEMKRG